MSIYGFVGDLRRRRREMQESVPVIGNIRKMRRNASEFGFIGRLRKWKRESQESGKVL